MSMDGLFEDNTFAVRNNDGSYNILNNMYVKATLPGGIRKYDENGVEAKSVDEITAMFNENNYNIPIADGVFLPPTKEELNKRMEEMVAAPINCNSSKSMEKVREMRQSGEYVEWEGQYFKVGETIRNNTNYMEKYIYKAPNTTQQQAQRMKTAPVPLFDDDDVISADKITTQYAYNNKVQSPPRLPAQNLSKSSKNQEISSNLNDFSSINSKNQNKNKEYIINDETEFKSYRFNSKADDALPQDVYKGDQLTFDEGGSQYYTIGSKQTKSEAIDELASKYTLNTHRKKSTTPIFGDEEYVVKTPPTVKTTVAPILAPPPIDNEIKDEFESIEGLITNNKEKEKLMLEEEIRNGKDSTFEDEIVENSTISEQKIEENQPISNENEEIIEDMGIEEVEVEAYGMRDSYPADTKAQRLFKSILFFQGKDVASNLAQYWLNNEEASFEPTNGNDDANLEDICCPLCGSPLEGTYSARDYFTEDGKTLFLNNIIFPANDKLKAKNIKDRKSLYITCTKCISDIQSEFEKNGLPMKNPNLEIIYSKIARILSLDIDYELNKTKKFKLLFPVNRVYLKHRKTGQYYLYDLFELCALVNYHWNNFVISNRMNFVEQQFIEARNNLFNMNNEVVNKFRNDKNGFCQEWFTKASYSQDWIIRDINIRFGVQCDSEFINNKKLKCSIGCEGCDGEIYANNLNTFKDVLMHVDSLPTTNKNKDKCILYFKFKKHNEEVMEEQMSENEQKSTENVENKPKTVREMAEEREKAKAEVEMVSNPGTSDEELTQEGVDMIIDTIEDTAKEESKINNVKIDEDLVLTDDETEKVISDVESAIKSEEDIDTLLTQVEEEARNNGVTDNISDDSEMVITDSDDVQEEVKENEDMVINSKDDLSDNIVDETIKTEEKSDNIASDEDNIVDEEMPLDNVKSVEEKKEEISTEDNIVDETMNVEPVKTQETPKNNTKSDKNWRELSDVEFIVKYPPSDKEIEYFKGKVSTPENLANNSADDIEEMALMAYVRFKRNQFEQQEKAKKDVNELDKKTYNKSFTDYNGKEAWNVDETEDYQDIKEKIRLDEAAKKKGPNHNIVFFVKDKVNKDPLDEGDTLHSAILESHLMKVLNLMNKSPLMKASGTVVDMDLTSSIPVIDFDTGIRLMYIDMEDEDLCPGLVNPMLVSNRVKFTYKKFETNYQLAVLYSPEAKYRTKQVAAALLKLVNFSTYPDYKFLNLSRDFVLTYTTEKKICESFENEHSVASYGKAKQESLCVIMLLDPKKAGSNKIKKQKIADAIRNEYYNTYDNGNFSNLQNYSMEAMCSIRYIEQKLVDKVTGLEYWRYRITQYDEHRACMLEDGLGCAITALIKEHHRKNRKIGYSVCYEFDRTLLVTPIIRMRAEMMQTGEGPFVIAEESANLQYENTKEAYMIVNPIYQGAGEENEKFSRRIDSRIMLLNEQSCRNFFRGKIPPDRDVSTKVQRLKLLESLGFIQYYEPAGPTLELKKEVLDELETHPLFYRMTRIDINQLRNSNAFTSLELQQQLEFQKYLLEMSQPQNKGEETQGLSKFLALSTLFFSVFNRK